MPVDADRGADERAERSDWTDLDLLTVGAAVRRLDEEIADVRAALAGPAEGDEFVSAYLRLNLLARARDRAAAGPRRPLYDDGPTGSAS